MRLRLIRLTPEDKARLEEMMEEWTATGERIIPFALQRASWKDFDAYLNSLEIRPPCPAGTVPDSTFFCLDEESGQLVGAVNIRHFLNEALLSSGGHIGDGVRPSWRGRGVATQMIGLALAECRKLGIRRVLMVCDHDNVASARSIERNGGVLEDERMAHGVLVRWYWIDVPPDGG